MTAIDGTALTEPQSVVRALRDDLIAGVYHPRERLVEADLAERYEVKRSAVRAALLELTTEGMVEREPNRGARVRALSLDEAIEITAVRGVLEALCASSAAERGTDDEREQLQAMIDDMRDKDDDIAAYHTHSAQFHEHIRVMGRQATASRLLVQLRNQSVQRHFPLAFASSRPVQGMQEHVAIAAAIVDGDVKGAETLMREHLDHVIVALRSAGMMHPSPHD